MMASRTISSITVLLLVVALGGACGSGDDRAANIIAAGASFDTESRIRLMDGGGRSEVGPPDWHSLVRLQPNGSKIFAADPGPLLVDRAGGEPIALDAPFGRVADAWWSRSGDRLAVFYDEGVVIFDSEGDAVGSVELQAASRSELQPWALDDAYLFAKSRCGLAVLSRDGQVAARLESVTVPWKPAGEPEWSPDGSISFATVSGRAEPSAHRLTMKGDGTFTVTELAPGYVPAYARAAARIREEIEREYPNARVFGGRELADGTGYWLAFAWQGDAGESFPAAGELPPGTTIRIAVLSNQSDEVRFAETGWVATRPLILTGERLDAVLAAAAD